MSVHPAHFQFTSDFPALLNDGQDTTSLTIPGGTVISGSGQYTNSVDMTVGAQGATVRQRFASSKDSNTYYVGAVSYGRTGTVSGSSTPYNIFAFVWRPDATTLRFQILIQNPTSSTLTCASGDETITVYVNTFIPPFSE